MGRPNISLARITAGVLPEIDKAYGTRLHKGAMAAIGETDRMRSNIAGAVGRKEADVMNHATNIASIGQRIRRAAPEVQPYLDQSCFTKYITSTIPPPATCST